MTQYTLGLTRLLGHGHAFTEVVAVPSPPVDSGFTYQVERYWEICDSLAFLLTTDSNAGNRQVKVTVEDGAGTALVTLPAASTQAASLTYAYTFTAGVSTFDTVIAAAVTSPMPVVLMQPGFKIVVAFTGGHAGDQISGVRLVQEKFVTGSEGYLLGVVETDSPRLTGAVDLAAVLA